MALKNLETARKNKAATHEREAQIQCAEKEAQAKPDDPQASYNLARLYTFYGKKELAYEWLTKALKQRFQTRQPRSHRAPSYRKGHRGYCGQENFAAGYRWLLGIPQSHLQSYPRIPELF
jgi:tetratricopeptide (TPR) repeat protein